MTTLSARYLLVFILQLSLCPLSLRAEIHPRAKRGLEAFHTVYSDNTHADIKLKAETDCNSSYRDLESDGDNVALIDDSEISSPFNELAILKVFADATNGAKWISPWNFSIASTANFSYCPSSRVPVFVPPSLPSCNDSDSFLGATSAPTDGFQGIVCDAANHVVEISLTWNNLTGVLSSDTLVLLRNLTFLRKLTLSHNPFLSANISELCEGAASDSCFPSLQILDVSFANISGELGAADLSFWPYLHRLGLSSTMVWLSCEETFDLCQNSSLSGGYDFRSLCVFEYAAMVDFEVQPLPLTMCNWLSSLGNCPLLQTLNLQYQYLEGVVPPSWSQLAAMQDLRLTSISFTSAPPDLFDRMRGSLRVLIMDQIKITSPFPAVIAQMPNLEVLQASYSSWTGSLPWNWAMASKLVVLDLNGCSNLTVPLHNITLPPFLSKFVIAETITPVQTSFSSFLDRAKIARLFLSTLNLVGTRLNGSIPPAIADFPALTILLISNTQVCGPIHRPDMVGIEATRLGVFQARNTLLCGCLPEIFEFLPVRSFDFSNTHMSIDRPACSPDELMSCDEFALTASASHFPDCAGISDDSFLLFSLSSRRDISFHNANLSCAQPQINPKVGHGTGSIRLPDGYVQYRNCYCQETTATQTGSFGQQGVCYPCPPGAACQSVTPSDSIFNPLDTLQTQIIFQNNTMLRLNADFVDNSCNVSECPSVEIDTQELLPPVNEHNVFFFCKTLYNGHTSSTCSDQALSCLLECTQRNSSDKAPDCYVECEGNSCNSGYDVRHDCDLCAPGFFWEPSGECAPCQEVYDQWTVGKISFMSILVVLVIWVVVAIDVRIDSHHLALSNILLYIAVDVFFEDLIIFELISVIVWLIGGGFFFAILSLSDKKTEHTLKNLIESSMVLLGTSMFQTTALTIVAVSLSSVPNKYTSVHVSKLSTTFPYPCIVPIHKKPHATIEFNFLLATLISFAAPCLAFCFKFFYKYWRTARKEKASEKKKAFRVSKFQNSANNSPRLSEQKHESDSEQSQPKTGAFCCTEYQDDAPSCCGVPNDFWTHAPEPNDSCFEKTVYCCGRSKTCATGRRFCNGHFVSAMTHAFTELCVLVIIPLWQAFFLTALPYTSDYHPGENFRVIFFAGVIMVLIAHVTLLLDVFAEFMGVVFSDRYKFKVKVDKTQKQSVRPIYSWSKAPFLIVIMSAGLLRFFQLALDELDLLHSLGLTWYTTILLVFAGHFARGLQYMADYGWIDCWSWLKETFLSTIAAPLVSEQSGIQACSSCTAHCPPPDPPQDPAKYLVEHDKDHKRIEAHFSSFSFWCIMFFVIASTIQDSDKTQGIFMAVTYFTAFGVHCLRMISLVYQVWFYVRTRPPEPSSDHRDEESTICSNCIAFCFSYRRAAATDSLDSAAGITVNAAAVPAGVQVSHPTTPAGAAVGVSADLATRFSDSAEEDLVPNNEDPSASPSSRRGSLQMLRIPLLVAQSQRNSTRQEV